MTVRRAQRRFFNRSERTTLFLAADGLCEECGSPLEPGWHADHAQPWSLGGATDVVNGQALCPACDQHKGASLSCNSDPIPTLRGWQQKALEKLSALSAADFLLVATPGSGKTRVAAEEIRRRFKAREIDRVVVVVPSDRLKHQWKQKVHHYAGIALEPDWRSDAPDMDGLVVTYQQVALGNAPRHRRDCRRPTMVVLDEIHHAGESRQWGEALRHAFEPARFRLALSGTPFRNDQNPIPFVTYVEGVAQADDTYGYGAALDDGVCRPVFFPRYGGRVEWSWGGKNHDHSFDDTLDDDQAARRLRTALNKGDFIPTVLRDADAQLTELRLEHPEAAGLVIAIDHVHARWIATQMQTLLKSEPELILSDDKDAGTKIDAFAQGKARWLVAVRMVSEGVDIPRLRVAVYATNIRRSELFFRQAVGRIVRVQPELDDNSAFFYIPDDLELRRFAELIKEERDHHLDALKDEVTRRDGERDQSTSSSFQPLGSHAEAAGTTFDGLVFSQAELAQAAALAHQAGLTRAEPAAAARLIRMVGGASSPPSSQPTTQPRSDRKRDLRSANSTMARRIAIEADVEFSHVNRQLNDEVGVSSVTKATEEQLEKRLDAAARWLEQLTGETGLDD